MSHQNVCCLSEIFLYVVISMIMESQVHDVIIFIKFYVILNYVENMQDVCKISTDIPNLK